LCIGLAVALGQVRPAEAGVVIKVRALNPLDTQESVTIHYPLPQELTQEDILQRKITYSLDHSEDEEPPKSEFNVSYSEDEGAYFIDDEVTLLPREVVTLEVHVNDVWVIPVGRVQSLRDEVEKLFVGWAPEAEVLEGELVNAAEGAEAPEESGEVPQEKGGEQPQGEDGEEAEGGDDGDIEETGDNDETQETALMMKGEILSALDKIVARQEANSILKVGVEQHMTAYNDNIKDMLQVRQDIALLTELMQYGPEGAQEEGGEVPVEVEETLSGAQDGGGEISLEESSLEDSLPGDSIVAQPQGDK
jgi:hypothetical protein